jgi:hypothetical protein
LVFELLAFLKLWHTDISITMHTKRLYRRVLYRCFTGRNEGN